MSINPSVFQDKNPRKVQFRRTSRPLFARLADASVSDQACEEVFGLIEHLRASLQMDISTDEDGFSLSEVGE